MRDDATHAASDDVPDEIVRSIHIKATAEVVFAIVREPGWFINDGEYRKHDVQTAGGISRVVDPVYGTFSMSAMAHEPPYRVGFRWLGGGMGEISDASNTVEFTIDPAGSSRDDEVRLTVRERGFARLSEDASVRRRNYEENSKGWEQELELARTLAEKRSPAVKRTD
ncbi:polyketide cyclase [Brachybacterium alimentarium]|uniref:polyketide cyclase n=1 Tax=Brachybacterium alimentarium TaxID=47845 RepID=UPI000BB723CE|nr:polyketide cyclase [Brachybacterium alimentarium]PCC33589.1 polyketide cyclase [Brachybacterium alimentarium]RCS74575.1 polyketide cyclase [Brachybacterium alimentarium]RCS75277.1 polyketide cyclase [Brachybacterium alimentarium]RCS79369.1 polyketide cyclase [Brachybacterium alimentarium]RCS82652.1 polyketide cyclase [Brachybacterium alimentarium]